MSFERAGGTTTIDAPSCPESRPPAFPASSSATAGLGADPPGPWAEGLPDARDRARLEHAAGIAELRQRFDALTARERDIMALVVQGLLNKQVAAALGVSEITVKVNRGHVMRKMNASSLADLVRIADRLSVGSVKP